MKHTKYKTFLKETKIPRWNIKTQSWENASKEYQEAQEDILDELKELTTKNAAMYVTDAWPNRDFDVVYGNKVIVAWDE